MDMTFNSWPTPLQHPTLSNDWVDVWRISLDVPMAKIAAYGQYLDEGEWNRANSFYFKRDKNHFIIAHGAVRILLGRYLDRVPEELRFALNPYGKPALQDENERRQLSFNLSHSQDYALLAVTCNREVGVDIEYIRPNLVDEQIAERFFSPREVGVLRSLEPDLQKEAFFVCWTRKEAFIKAKGQGLSIPLNSFDVSLSPDEPAELLQTREDPSEAGRWKLQALEPQPGYKGTVAAEGNTWNTRIWNWEN
jgi:4'-phosphopantetheinyl transferase